ncbi:isopropylmalate isomerase [Marinobacter confluentis]|uniref:Isopropylmalate isomerase n=1 Tax=Marinobacter confluentis TaxID=1697557 RepID=A0A4Z1BE84_9GAMM|nr:isopropylmalate isomerase [Marinobacter confluentis]
MLLSACSTVPEAPGVGSNRQALIDGLADEPKACGQYRRLYVQGFKANVAALSDSDDALKSEAERLLRQSTDLLDAAGVEQRDCSRPYCIIEPLQGGRLDSWCGFRIAADEGEELYQWLNWSDLGNSGPSQ